MQTLQIPASIWLNFLVLVVAVGFVWFKLMGAGKKVRRKNGTRPDGNAGRTAPVDR